MKNDLLKKIIDKCFNDFSVRSQWSVCSLKQKLAQKEKEITSGGRNAIFNKKVLTNWHELFNGSESKNGKTIQGLKEICNEYYSKFKDELDRLSIKKSLDYIAFQCKERSKYELCAINQDYQQWGLKNDGHLTADLKSKLNSILSDNLQELGLDLQYLLKENKILKATNNQKEFIKSKEVIKQYIGQIDLKIKKLLQKERTTNDEKENISKAFNKLNIPSKTKAVKIVLIKHLAPSQTHATLASYIDVTEKYFSEVINGKKGKIG